MHMAETKLLLLIFFGVALVIGVYFTWILLRKEMDGKPEEPEDPYDYGFGPAAGKGRERR